MLQEREQSLSRSQETLRSPEREAFPKVAVVLLHHGLAENGGEAIQYTEQCLDSVATIDYSNFEVVVLDAGSTDGFSKRYKEGFSDAFPQLSKTTLLHLEENVGCARGYNMAVEHAIKEGAEYLFLLNNDTIILNSNILSNLVEVVERFPEAAAIGPKIYHWREKEGPETIQFIGGSFVCGVIGAGQEDRGQFDEERVVDFVSGAAMLVRADAIKEIGELFYPPFRRYFEELDFAARAGKVGYKCIYSPGGQVRHKGRHSIDRRFKSPYVEESAWNSILLCNRHSGKQKAQFALRALNVIGHSIFGIITREKRPDQLEKLADSICDIRGWGWRLDLVEL